jgi:hypothetical protein
MKMILTENGWVQKRERSIIEEMRHTFPISTAYIVDTPSIKESIKNMDFLKGKGRKAYSIAMPTLVLGVATGGSGVFWDAFMTYIFPWMLDIAKVFCAIKIAQAFYQERRGGRDEGSGFGAVVQYGKWYLVFWLIPWGVELIDQIGGKMLNELRQGASMN